MGVETLYLDCYVNTLEKAYQKTTKTMILRDKDKQRLIQLFSRIESPVEVLAYGNRVNNTAHEASDLDLVIRTKNGEPINKNVYSELQEQLKQSNIPILVELRDWTTLPKSFHLQIEKNCELIYSNFK